MHILAVQTWSDDLDIAYGFNGPAWSVGVEFFLYACFPILVFALSLSLKTVRAALALAVITTAGMVAILLIFKVYDLDQLPVTVPNSAHRWLYRTPLLRLGDFVLGFAAAHLFLASKGRPNRWFAFAAQAVLVGAVAVMMSSSHFYFSAASFDVLYAAPTSALLYLLAVRPNVGLGALLALPVVVALGEASYAFYLVHRPIGDAMGMGFVGNDGSADELLVYLYRIVIIAVFAWGIHVTVERPARRLLRRSLSRA